VRTEAVNFQRDEGTTGQRVDVEPTLDWRTERNGAHFGAAASWRPPLLAQRRAVRRRRVAAAYGAHDHVESGFVLGGRRARMAALQTLEPRLLYLYVPYRDQDELPVFDTGCPTEYRAVVPHQSLRGRGSRRRRNQVSVG